MNCSLGLILRKVAATFAHLLQDSTFVRTQMLFVTSLLKRLVLMTGYFMYFMPFYKLLGSVI